MRACNITGIGSFTIVDGNLVQPSDLGNNFFLDFESLGKSRAAATTVHLNELNEFVRGNAVEKVCALAPVAPRLLPPPPAPSSSCPLLLPPPPPAPMGAHLGEQANPQQAKLT